MIVLTALQNMLKFPWFKLRSHSLEARCYSESLKLDDHYVNTSMQYTDTITAVKQYTSREHLRTKVTPDLHLRYSKNGGNLGLILK